MAERVEIEVNGNTYWYDQAEEQALKKWEIDRQKFKSYIMTEETESAVHLVGRAGYEDFQKAMEECYNTGNSSLVEEITPLQNQLNDLNYQAACKIEVAKKQGKRFSERMGYKDKKEESIFLDNIEK